MINAIDIRKIVDHEIGDLLLPAGYSKIKVKADEVASYEKHDSNNYYEFHCHMEKYNDYKLVYGFSFGINRIVQILKEIDMHVPLERRKYNIHNWITGYSPGLLLDPLDISRAYKYFSNEQELLQILQEVKLFYEQQFVPFCEKYSNVSELDKLMNSPIDFWIKGRGKGISMPIAFFPVSRLIIARLANNPNFDEVVERNFQALEEAWKAEGAVYDRNEETRPEVFAAKYLKERSYELDY
jgi:hypothetical protein